MMSGIIALCVIMNLISTVVCIYTMSMVRKSVGLDEEQLPSVEYAKDDEEIINTLSDVIPEALHKYNTFTYGESFENVMMSNMDVVEDVEIITEYEEYEMEKNLKR